MNHVLIVGGGMAGCAIAGELSENGIRVTLIEAADDIGGKVRGYGCKATEACNNCGVCLSAGLWGKVKENNNIEIIMNARLVDLMGKKGCFTAAVKNGGGIRFIEGISDVVVATGFRPGSLESFNSFVELTGTDRIITGSDLERLFRGRTEAGLFDKPPSSVAFIQCYGSRDSREKAMYCSKVCCAYSTRAAKVIRSFYPECEVVFYYMELQMVNEGNYFQELKDLGAEFVRCRPVHVDGANGIVEYDDPASGKREGRCFDLIVLSDGIRPTADADSIAEICGLCQDETGFLKYTTGLSETKESGVFIAGCAGGPKKIEDVYAESASIVREILLQDAQGTQGDVTQRDVSFVSHVTQGDVPFVSQAITKEEEHERTDSRE